MLTVEEAEGLFRRVRLGVSKRTGRLAKFTLNSCHGCIEYEEAIDEFTLPEGVVSKLTVAQARAVDAIFDEVLDDNIAGWLPEAAFGAMLALAEERLAELTEEEGEDAETE